MRRPTPESRVIGTLMGRMSDDFSVIYINNCFPVSHTENAENVGVNAESHHTMLELFQKVNNQDVIVGWYATGKEINSNSSLLHEFFRSESKGEKTLHLLVDTEAELEGMAYSGMKGFVGSLMGTEVNPCGISFVQLTTILDVESSKLDRIALDLMKANASNGPFSVKNEVETVKDALARLSDLIKKVVEKGKSSPAIDQALFNFSNTSAEKQDLANVLQMIKALKMNMELVDKTLAQ